MQQRAQRRIVYLVVHIVGLLLGLLILGYAVYAWNGYGFTLGRNHHFYPGSPDPSFGARWLFLVGLATCAYCAFALWNFSRCMKALDRDARDDVTPTI